MDSNSEDGDENVCPICFRCFDTMAAIRQHWTKGHTIDAAIDNRSRSINTPSQQPSTTSALLGEFQGRLARNTSASSCSGAMSSSEILTNRATCNICGFLAKNDRGLNIHMGIHNRNINPSPPELQPPMDLDLRDEASIIQKFGKLIYKCKCSIPMVRIIQKSVRSSACQELTRVVENVVAKNDLFSWCRLLNFPLIVFNTIPKRCYKDKHRPNIVHHNLSILLKLQDISSLFHELLQLLAVDLPKKKSSQSEKLLIKIAQIGEGDISGAVRVLSSLEGIADNTEETILQLKQKHPTQISTIEEEIIINQEQFDTSKEQVANAIRHFPISSSGGVDGLRPRHLKDLISFSSRDASAKLTSAIAALVNIIRSGKICSKLLPIFYGASLIALAKLNGDIRPIAIGLVWRRLGGKIACFSVKDSLSEVLKPIQNGFGVRGGSESIVHAVRAYSEASHEHPKAIVKFDFRNAFNEMFRKHLLAEVKTVAFPMLQQAYRCPSNLFFGDVIIQSKRGAQQGDPCAPAAFSIGLMPLTHSLAAELNSWFLDEGAIGA